MNGRVYDPTIGRFLSADPIIQTIALSQAINPYSYVMNIPLALIDPSGYSWLSKLFSSIGNFFESLAHNVGFRFVLAVLVAVALPYLAPHIFHGLAGSMLAGAIAGGIAAGNLQGAIYGALSAGFTYGLMSGLRLGGAHMAMGFDKAVAVASGGDAAAVQAAAVTGAAEGQRLAGSSSQAESSSSHDQINPPPHIADIRARFATASAEEQHDVRTWYVEHESQIWAVHNLYRPPSWFSRVMSGGMEVASWYFPEGKMWKLAELGIHVDGALHLAHEIEAQSHQLNRVPYSMMVKAIDGAAVGNEYILWNWGPYKLGSAGRTADFYYWVIDRITERPATCVIDHTC